MHKEERLSNEVLEAVIMDMDGTMIDTEPLHEAALYEALRKVGLDSRQVVIEELWGLSVNASVPVMRKWYGEKFDAEDYLRIFRGELRRTLSTKSIPMKTGVVEFLDRMQQAGLDLAVASSSDRSTIDLSLAQVGLSGYFSQFVGGDEVEHGKPAPDIFLKAAEQLGVSPQACLVVEDSPPGVAAASRAGMHVYWVPDGHMPNDPDCSQAKGVYRDLHEALAAVEAWLF